MIETSTHHVVSDDPEEPDYRFTLANERTFLAWQRSSLGLLAVALAALHFLPEHVNEHLALGLGSALGLLATLTAIGGLSRWRHNDAAIRDNAPLPGSRMPVVLALVLATISAVGVIAAVALAF
jgi:putative membrane protein